MGGNGILLRRRGNEGKETGGLALKRKNQTSPMTLSMDGKSLSNGKGVEKEGDGLLLRQGAGEEGKGRVSPKTFRRHLKTFLFNCLDN